ncbi:tetratricopeptide repeat protein [Roseibacillus ishigakijimensis]|uniref:Tetratricopeptide repeat protein n=1 Tax=Roseibacillus ishigakijimensis TaxID=454146 RepID=A0A934RNA5_9BACT|nr:tetratricopeptide repeat protein [Roseibacillus ishigakijimensis]MBK1832797.1 tetratricopeptide repeat protein [Roseibacillus ishigakijimensis]
MLEKPLLSLLSLALASTDLMAQEGEPSPAPDEPAPLQADPARDLFEAGQLAYAEGKASPNKGEQQVAYESALRTFDRFRQAFPQHPNSAEAQFYMASCYEKLGQQGRALATYTALANSGLTSPLVEAAAQQVAATYYQAKKYAEAEPIFARLAQVTGKAQTRHLALYQRALCLQHLDRQAELKEALRAVVFDDGSPYSEKARAAISALYAKTGDKERAYANYRLLADSSDKATAANAILQSALLARELGREREAAGWFERILTTPELGKWHGKAQLTLMTRAYDEPDFPTVVRLYERGTYSLPKNEEAQRLALAAEAYRQIGQGEKANQLYERLAKVSTNKNQAFDAAYAVLTREYQKGQDSFLKAGEDFLKQHGKNHSGDGRLDNVHLMLAEKYSSRKKFREAAHHYQALDLTRVAADNVAQVRYRLAYARMKAGQLAEARDAFADFLHHHPKDKNAVRALAHRASLLTQSGAHEAAMADYERLLTLTDDPAFRLPALSGMAEYYREKEDFAKLIEIHEKLLREFPQRSPREQAASHFVLGWAHYKRENWQQATPALTRARELNPQGVGRDATIHLALIHFSQQDEKALQSELDRLQRDFPGNELPRPIYAWLGAKKASEGAYQEAWQYLPQAVTLEDPAETKTAVWKAYARTAEVLGHHRETLQACDILLPTEDSDYLRAVLLHRKAKALLGLRQYEEATTVAKTALELKPQGELNAALRLTLGDIARGQKLIDEALGHYVVVAEIIGKGSHRTTALLRAIELYQEKGDATSLAEAAKYRALLP